MSEKSAMITISGPLHQELMRSAGTLGPGCPQSFEMEFAKDLSGRNILKFRFSFILFKEPCSVILQWSQTGFRVGAAKAETCGECFHQHFVQVLLDVISLMLVDYLL